jgi:hypothetical protein
VIYEIKTAVFAIQNCLSKGLGLQCSILGNYWLLKFSDRFSPFSLGLSGVPGKILFRCLGISSFTSSRKGLAPTDIRRENMTERQILGE